MLNFFISEVLTSISKLKLKLYSCTQIANEIQWDFRRQYATIAQGEFIKHFPLKTNNTESEINTITNKVSR